MYSQLKEFGLSNNEQAVVIQLLTHGPASVLELSKMTQIKRPTVYLAVEALIESGLVNRRVIGRRAIFESIPREAFAATLLERARRRLGTQEQAAHELAQAIAALSPPKDKQVGGLLVESISSERGLYREMYENLLRGDYCGIFNPQLAVNKITKPLLIDFLKKTAYTKPNIREIAVAGEMCEWYRNHIKNPNHTLKMLPAKTEYLTDLILTEDTVILLDYSPKSPAAVKIKQKNLFLSFTTIFEELWSRL